MKVPTYTSDVQLATPQTQAPRQPRVASPGVVPGAFGADVGRALQGLGEVGEKVSAHLQQLSLDKQDIEVQNRKIAYRKAYQDALLNQEDESVNINGQQVTRKKGLLLQQMALADGATERLDKFHASQIEPNAIKGLTQYQYNKLYPEMDAYYQRVRERVITHEANQYDSNLENTAKSSLSQRVLDASIIRDPEELSTEINSAIKDYSLYNKRFDKATQDINNEKIASRIIEASAVSALQNTGDLPFSQALLDSNKDKIAQSTYNEIKSKLAQGYKSMTAETERIRVENRVNERFDYISKIADGTLDWANSSDIIKQVAMTDPKLAEAMVKNIKKGDIELESENSAVFMELAGDIFTSSDEKAISDFLVRSLSETKNISRDRLAILVYAAKLKADELKKGEGKGFLDNLMDILKIQSPESAPWIFKNIMNRTKNENAEGERILEIGHEEVKKQGIKDNPGRSLYKLNEIYDTPLGPAKVIGFDVDGEPLLDNDRIRELSK